MRDITKLLFLKVIYRVSTVNAIQIKISAVLFFETDKFILKSIWKCEVLRISKAILRKKVKIDGLIMVLA